MAADERDACKREKGGLVGSGRSICSASHSWGGGDGMKESELDAAQALADFAHMAFMMETQTTTATTNTNTNTNGGSTNGGGGESDRRKWGNKGKRSVKRVKRELSPLPTDWGSLNLRSAPAAPAPAPAPALTPQDPFAEDDRSVKKVYENMTISTVKAEHHIEIPNSKLLCSTSVSFGGGRPRSQLTEAEKEARRIRRILANRESARQTIRRRQAMCEEMARKAAELQYDNENIKQEKELVMREYQLLMDRNKHLKTQMARLKKTKTEEVPVECANKVPEVAPSNHVKAETSSEKPALIVYNSPVFTPYVWPSIIQPMNTTHTQAISQETSSSQDPMASTFKLNPSHEHANHPATNGPRPPFYIVPCPWFFPLPDHGKGVFAHPRDSCSSRDKQDDTYVDNQQNIGSSSKATEVENSQPSLPRKVKADTNPGQAKSTNDLPDISARSLNGEAHFLAHPCGNMTSTNPTYGESHSSSHCSGKSLMPIPLSSLKPSTLKLKCDDGQPVSKEDSASSTSGPSATAFQEDIVGQCAYPSKVDAGSAAEARKRRKELTKLKNLNGRQVNLRC